MTFITSGYFAADKIDRTLKLSSGHSMWKSQVVSSVFTVKLFLFTYTNNQKLDEGEKEERREEERNDENINDKVSRGAHVEGWHRIDLLRKEITSNNRLL